MYTLSADFNIHNYMDFNNFKIEKKKEDLPFYDPDNNMKFFNKMYIMIGMVPYNVDPSIEPIFNELLSKYADIINDIKDRLDKVHLDDHPRTHA